MYVPLITYSFEWKNGFFVQVVKMVYLFTKFNTLDVRENIIMQMYKITILCQDNSGRYFTKFKSTL